MKKLATFILALAVLSFATSAAAENFDIINYDVEILVDKNKSAFITETIDVNFFNPSHGIYREIPYKNASITDISVSETKQNFYSPDSVNIKIGDPNQLISGPHRYIIRYRYNYYDNATEFYHNIIGTEWKTNINNVTFKVILPEPINSSQTGLSIGYSGTKGFDGDALYQVNGNVISGKTLRNLAPHEGVTLRVEVPSGYFNVAENPMKKYSIPFLFLFTIVAFMTWFIHGKDEPVTPFVNFYPIKGLNAIEHELAYKGKASTKGIVALLIELAEKGYIKIDDHKPNWTLHKLRPLSNDLDENQRDLMKALFKSGDEVNKNDLKISRTFYKNCRDIIDDVNQKRNKIFYASSIGFPLRALMYICIAGLMLLTALSIFDFNTLKLINNFPLLLFPAIAILILILMLASKDKNPLQVIYIIIWASCFGGMPLYDLISNGISSNSLPNTIFGIICLIIAAVCTYQLPKRNPRGQKFLNHVEGLKQFIDVAEKNKIKELVEQDPQYFYNILPTAYILNVSDKWINKFEDIMTIAPEWYSGSHLSSNRFNVFTKNFNSVSIPSTSNGGISRSSGGGGHAGGGGGGGGGGSW